MDGKGSGEGENYREMKPPFMMMKPSLPGLLLKHSINSIVPGKLADESQLGQLTSLFSDNEQVKRYHAPKPPKKRYLEENYSQNNRVNPVYEHVAKSVQDISNLPDVKKKKIDENVIYLPDVIQKTEGKDAEARMERRSWRKKLLCWEKLDDCYETPKSCDRLDQELENESIELNNNSSSSPSDSPTRLLSNHCLNDSNSTNNPSPGRRGGARACKGQKYREFMWTNVMHQRRKSSRWELCQDAAQTTANHDNVVTDKFKTELHENNKSELVSCVKRRYIHKVKHNESLKKILKTNTEMNGIDKFYKKKKLTKKKLSKAPESREVNNFKKESSESPKKKLLKREISNQNNSKSSELSLDKTSEITGSKKRKLRRQSIRRLEPGSSFKDTSVVEDSGLATLASIAANKKKLRSDNTNA